MELATQYAYDATVSIGDFVLNAGFDVQTGISVSTGQTPVIWGSIVSGQCEYYYTDINGLRTLKTGYYTMSTMMQDAYVICNTEDLYLQAHSTGSSGSSPTVFSQSNIAHLWGGAYYTFTVTDKNSGLVSSSASTVRIGSDIVYYVQGQTPAYPYYTSTNSYNFARFKSADFSNRSNLQADVIVPMTEGATYSFDDARQMIIDAVNESVENGDTINPDDIPTWEELYPTEPSTDPTEPTTDQNGNIIINNYDVLNVYATFENDVNIDINGSVEIGAGAFGAGAFGAGAFGTVDIDVNANAFGAGSADFVLNVDGSLNIPELNLSGNTITHNNYDGAQITQNVYTIQVESGASLELPSYPAIDYDEILSPSELAEVLEGDETYYIEPVETGLYALELQTLPPMEALPEQVTLVSGAVLSEGVGFLNDFGLSSVYTPLAIFTIICYILKRGR